MSKKVKSQAIYDSMKDQSRADIIEAFVNQLEMTPAGAATYYANCKRSATGGSFNTTVKPEKEGKSDGRTLYTVCTPGENEFHEIVVQSTGSHFRLADALKEKTDAQCIVKGLPEIDSDWGALKPFNKDCKSCV